MSKEKTKSGEISKGFTFLGYTIKGNKISVRQKTIDGFIKNIAKEFNWFKKVYKNPYTLGVGKVDKDLIKTRFINQLNDKITGVVIDDKKYGWLFYFNEINDTKILYILDRVIDRFFGQLDQFKKTKPTDVKKFSRAYYEGKYNLMGKYIRNFNQYTTENEKKTYLSENIILDKSRKYSSSEIDYLFEKAKFQRMNSLKLDLGKLS